MILYPFFFFFVLCAGSATHHWLVRGPQRWTQPHLPAGGPLWRDSGEFAVIFLILLSAPRGLVWLSLRSCCSTLFGYWSWWTSGLHFCMCWLRNVSWFFLPTCWGYAHSWLTSALVFWWWSFKTLISFLCFHLVSSLHCLVSFLSFWVL